MNDVLKGMIRQTLGSPRVPRLLGLTGPKGVGKSTFAKNLRGESDRLCHIASFADTLKDMLEVLVGRKYVDHAKEEVVPWLGVTGRFLMQRMGTEFFREQVDQDIWVKCAEQDIKQLLEEPLITVIFDDVRFENEAEMIKRRGGEVWKLSRAGVVSNDTHASESGIPAELIDRVVKL